MLLIIEGGYFRGEFTLKEGREEVTNRQEMEQEVKECQNAEFSEHYYL